MASFITELKRRNVFKVGVAYAIVAWLLIQIIVAIETPLRLPEWVDTLTIIFLIIGFPITLIIAWAFELTPEGIKSSKSIDPAESITQTTGQKLNYMITILLSIAMVIIIVDNYVIVEEVQVTEPMLLANTTEITAETETAVVTDEPERLSNSVAILPFENLSLDPENAFFAAGIHESTLNQLAKIRDLTVMARTSVMQYENNPPPIPEIAEALNVEMVMEGSVRYADNRVLITAQLIDGRTGAHVWSEEFNRDLTDIFGVQAEIAENIVIALQAELLPNERQRIAKVQTNSPESLSLYLQASNLGRGPGGVGAWYDLHRYLDQAIELDPGFARAHALKAFDYSVAMSRYRSPNDPEVSELERLAFEYAGRALSLDPEEGLAYVALANTHAYNWRGTEALAAFERALELAPNDPWNLDYFTVLLIYLGENERAIELALRSNELDPFTSVHGRAYLAAGNFEAAYTAWNDVLRVNPNTAYNYYMKAITEWHLGNKESAFISMQNAERLLSDNGIFGLERIIRIYGLIGRQEDALRVFGIFEQKVETYQISASQWASVYLGIGDYAQVMTWLNQIDEDRNPEDATRALQLAVNWFHNPVLERPEFVEIRNKLSLRR